MGVGVMERDVGVGVMEKEEESFVGGDLLRPGPGVIVGFLFKSPLGFMLMLLHILK